MGEPQRISIEEAIAIVQRETGGRVLDARAQGQQYRIKVLTRSGEVRICRFTRLKNDTRFDACEKLWMNGA